MVLVSAGIVLATLFLAYSNGANDNPKGVATLLGSGTIDYRRALIWATATTLAGSLLALLLARGLVATFSGRGLVSDTVAAQPQFRLAVSLGAALTVILATRMGLPVSTTHALVGAGGLAAAGDIRLRTLGTAFVLPLLVSPVAAMLLTLLVYPALRWIGRARGADNPGTVLNGMHFLSAGAVGFARGLNDTPKIVALMLASDALDPNVGLVAVAAAMGLGGAINGRRVAETMSQKITRMSPGQGMAANLVTSLLVTSASRWGLPVSTTHVAVGSLFGIGIVTGTARARTVAAILLAWVTTLPLAAVASAAIYLVLRAVAAGG